MVSKMVNITEVRIKSVLPTKRRERLLAFCSITFDNCFVVRDLKVIDGQEKGLFIAMPSRHVMDHCPKCQGKNSLQATYCNWCGIRLPLL